MLLLLTTYAAWKFHSDFSCCWSVLHVASQSLKVNLSLTLYHVNGKLLGLGYVEKCVACVKFVIDKWPSCVHFIVSL